jgi:N-acetylneuraminic acid mutarotase
LRGGAFTAVDLVFAYDPTRNVWEDRTPLPQARGAGAAAVIDGLIYVAGGVRGGQSVGDFAVFDPAMNAWTELPAMPTERDHLAAAAIDGLFYAFGGRFGQLFDALEAYNPQSRQWTTLAPMPTARGGLAGAALGGRLFAFGGEGNSADPNGIFPQTEVYDPAANMWGALPDLPTPRHGMGAAAFGDRIYVPGGGTVAGFGASAANEALRP